MNLVLSCDSSDQFETVRIKLFPLWENDLITKPARMKLMFTFKSFGWKGEHDVLSSLYLLVLHIHTGRFVRLIWYSHIDQNTFQNPISVSIDSNRKRRWILELVVLAFKNVNGQIRCCELWCDHTFTSCASLESSKMSSVLHKQSTSAEQTGFCQRTPKTTHTHFVIFPPNFIMK